MDPWVVVALVIIAVLIFLLPGFVERQKLKPIIDAALQAGLSQEAIVILLARDATRSLGRVLTNAQVDKIKRIVAARVARINDQTPIEKTDDVEDVFRYLNQAASPFLLQKDERIIAMVPAVGLREPRSIRTTYGTYGGPSFRVAKGVSIHTGVSRSTSSSREELKDIDGGDLVITNQRLFFAGKQRTSNAQFKKIVSLEPSANSFVLHKDGKDRAQYFLWPNNLLKVKDDSGESQPLSGFFIQSLIEKQLGH